MAERGENCLIAVAGQPTAVTNSAIAGIIDEAGKGTHLAEIYGAVAGVAGLLEGKLSDLGAQKRKTIEGLRRTPGSVLSGRHRILSDADGRAIIDTLRSNDIGTLFLLGGLPTVGLLKFIIEAAEKAGYPLQAMGIPLSAENDVDAGSHGDHTPGYGSAARFAAQAARDAGRVAAGGEEPIVVLELPGANSGWVAAAAVLARDEANPAPHAVLVPERAVNLDALVEEVRRAYQRYGYAVVVTTEGVKATDGQSLNGDALAAQLSQQVGVSARADKPGSLVRVTQSTIARTDGDEAYHLGTQGVQLSADDCSGYLVTVRRDTHGNERDKSYRAVEGTVHITQVGEGARQLPENYLTETGTNVSDAFIDWARPLIGGALPEYINLS